MQLGKTMTKGKGDIHMFSAYVSEEVGRLFICMRIIEIQKNKDLEVSELY